MKSPLPPIRTRLLMAGIELNIYDEMTSFRSAADIASSINAHAGNTERFLNALVTIDIVEKRYGLYGNGPEAAEFFVSCTSAHLGGLLKMFRSMSIEPLDSLVDLVKGGPTELEDKGFFISFQDGMTHEHTKPGIMLGHLWQLLSHKKTGVVLPSQNRWVYRIKEGFWLSRLDIEPREKLRLEYEKNQPTLNLGFLLSGHYINLIKAQDLTGQGFSNHEGTSGILYLHRQEGDLIIPGQTHAHMVYIHLSPPVFYDLFHVDMAALPSITLALNSDELSPFISLTEA